MTGKVSWLCVVVDLILHGSWNVVGSESQWIFETFWKLKGMSLTLTHLGRIPKLYVPQGLLSRVQTALVQRIRTFMASADSNVNAQARGRGEALDADLARNAAGQAEATEQPTIEVDDNGKKETETSDDDLEKEKEPESRERSRSPRGDGQAEDGAEEDLLKDLRKISDCDPRNPTEVLAACNGLAIGLTTLVAAIKSNTDRMNLVINQGQAVQVDLCKSMLTLSQSIQSMSHAVESLSAGVGYSTSRVGALVGETQKVRKFLDWFGSKSLVGLHKESTKRSEERDEKFSMTIEGFTN